MRFNKLLLVVPFLCFTALIGCKPSCESLCDDAKEEDCKDLDHDECVHQCITVEDMQKDTDKCDEEYDSLLSCINDQSDICKAFEPDADDPTKIDKCNSEWVDMNKCVKEYCDDHDSRDYCSQFKLD